MNTTTTTYNYPATGIYSLDNSAVSLIHCSVETSLCDDYEVSIQLGMLYQNTTSEIIEDATFFCKLDSVDSALTSFACSVERSDYIDQESRFERRPVKRAIKDGASFQCSVGNIPAGSDAIIFISWITRVLPTTEELQLLVPLPSKETESSFSIPTIDSTTTEVKTDSLVLKFDQETEEFANFAMDEDYESDCDSEWGSSSDDEDNGPETPLFGGSFYEEPTWTKPAFETVYEDSYTQQQQEEEEEYVYQNLTPPPARRLHPFLDEKFAKSQEEKRPVPQRKRSFIEPKHKVSLDHVRPEYA
ncbi:hypothetical protein BZA77DRAFT_323663 [Pyronema omphalodes]|nr:hypothetical protein BZA77DRAFT_323663 [Pyronema omphalodes]